MTESKLELGDQLGITNSRAEGLRRQGVRADLSDQGVTFTTTSLATRHGKGRRQPLRLWPRSSRPSGLSTGLLQKLAPGWCLPTKLLVTAPK